MCLVSDLVVASYFATFVGNKKRTQDFQDFQFQYVKIAMTSCTL